MSNPFEGWKITGKNDYQDSSVSIVDATGSHVADFRYQADAERFLAMTKVFDMMFKSLYETHDMLPAPDDDFEEGVHQRRLDAMRAASKIGKQEGEKK